MNVEIKVKLKIVWIRINCLKNGTLHFFVINIGSKSRIKSSESE